MTLLGRTARAAIPPLAIQVDHWEDAIGGAGCILLAVPDDAIAAVAARLQSLGAVRSPQVVLHLSGLLDRGALAALAPSGAALGSFHPLQTIADPAAAPERFLGAYAGLEGDARAIRAGHALADALGMHSVELPASAKPLYHAAATLVAGGTVALFGAAGALAARAGVDEATVHQLYLALLRGATENLAALGSAGAALTGPVRRGDVATVAAHLDALEPAERRLYVAVSLVALRLARAEGLDAEAADRIERLLTAVSHS